MARNRELLPERVSEVPVVDQDGVAAIQEAAADGLRPRLDWLSSNGHVYTARLLGTKCVVERALQFDGEGVLRRVWQGAIDGQVVVAACATDREAMLLVEEVGRRLVEVSLGPSRWTAQRALMVAEACNVARRVFGDYAALHEAKGTEVGAARAAANRELERGMSLAKEAAMELAGETWVERLGRELMERIVRAAAVDPAKREGE